MSEISYTTQSAVGCKAATLAELAKLVASEIVTPEQPAGGVTTFIVISSESRSERKVDFDFAELTHNGTFKYIVPVTGIDSTSAYHKLAQRAARLLGFKVKSGAPKQKLASSFPTHRTVGRIQESGHVLTPEAENLRSTMWPAWKGDEPQSNSLDNIVFGLGLLELTVRYNELAQTIEINDRPIDDDIVASILQRLQRMGLTGLKKDSIYSALQAMRIEQPEVSYHPLRELADSAPWDGVDRIAVLASKFDVDSDKLTPDKVVYFLRKWLVNLARKTVVTDISTQGFMLVLQSNAQGRKKGWAVNHYFSFTDKTPVNENTDEITSKDFVIKLTKSPVVYLDELDAQRTAKDQAALKAIVTMKSASVRAPYARTEVTRPVIASLIGSTNSESWLRDASGNRRFVVLPIREIQIDQDFNSQQLLAQAVTIARDRNFVSVLQQEDFDFLAATNEQFTLHDAITDLLTERAVAGTDKMALHDVLTSLDSNIDKESHANLTKAGAVLARLGFVPEVVRTSNGGRRKLYSLDRKALSKPAITDEQKKNQESIRNKSNVTPIEKALNV